MDIFVKGKITGSVWFARAVINKAHRPNAGETSSMYSYQMTTDHLVILFTEMLAQILQKYK